MRVVARTAALAAPTALAALAALAAGCAAPAPDATKDDDYEPFNPNPEGIACSGAFRVLGLFTPGLPGPTPHPDRPGETPTGCWPVGTWVFSASHDRQREVLDITGDQVGDRCGYFNDTALPALRDLYAFRVVREPDYELGEWKDTYVLLSDVGTDEVMRLDVSGDGGGECEGDLELRSADGLREWIFKPALEGTEIKGFGEYIEFLPP